MTHYSKSHDTLSKEPLVKAPRYFIKRHMVKKNRNALWNEPLGKEPYYFLKRPIVKESQCILQWPTNQRATIIKYSKTVLPSVMSRNVPWSHNVALNHIHANYKRTKLCYNNHNNNNKMSMKSHWQKRRKSHNWYQWCTDQACKNEE